MNRERFDFENIKKILIASDCEVINSYTDESPTEFDGVLDFIYILDNLLYFCFTDTENYRRYKLFLPLEYSFNMPDFSNNAFHIENNYATNGDYLGIYRMDSIELNFLLEENQILIPEVDYCQIETIICPHCNEENIEVFLPMSERIYFNNINNDTVVLEGDCVFRNLTYISKEISHCINEYTKLYNGDGCKKELIDKFYVNICPRCKGIISDNYALEHSVSSAIDGGIIGLKNGILVGSFI